MPDQPLLSLRDLLATVIDFLPALLSGLLVLLVGALVSWVAARIVIRLLIWLRLHRVVERLHWGTTFSRGDIRHALYTLIGALVGAFTFLVFLDRALVLWQLTVLSSLLERLVLFVPELLVATVILLIGAGVAAAAARSVRSALYEEELVRATLVARIVRAAILVLTVAITLVQLNVAPALIRSAFLIAFGAIAVTFVLAVGLGSRKAVEAMWEDVQGRRRGDAADRGEGDDV